MVCSQEKHRKVLPQQFKKVTYGDLPLWLYKYKFNMDQEL